MLTRGNPDRTRALSDRSEAKIREADTAGVVHEDIWLVRRQYCGEARYNTTHSLEIPVYYIAGVEIMKALSGIG